MIEIGQKLWLSGTVSGSYQVGDNTMVSLRLADEKSIYINLDHLCTLEQLVPASEPDISKSKSKKEKK